MKNLKMNLQQFGNVEVLTRSQMKNVVGGQEPKDQVGGECENFTCNVNTCTTAGFACVDMFCPDGIHTYKGCGRF